MAGLVGSSSSTALKRASSDEDLSQSAAQGDTYADESDMPHEPRLVSGSRNGNLGRVRSCNESFRAAVDRSYDALDSSAPMDTCRHIFYVLVTWLLCCGNGVAAVCWFVATV